MISFLDRVCDQLNLRWAWEKVKKASVPGDVWVDEAALASFDMRLGAELESIAADLKGLRYKIAPIRPMAFPKNPDEDGNPRVRQYFNFAIRDQVAWVAVVNVLGPYVDVLMPSWSYGNRLFRSTWIEENEQHRMRRIGPYRHSSGRIYRPFHQSWPIFRRHVALAVNAAAGGKHSELNLDQEELEELQFQLQLDEKLRCPFVRPEYWAEGSKSPQKRDVYWASVDLEKFYPSIKLDECVAQLEKCMPDEARGQARDVLQMLTRFPLDTSDWTDQELALIELSKSRKRIDCIPTGLLVSGFLANAALLSVDYEVERQLPRGKIAHFRYVDDHVILATSFDDLLQWIRLYQSILEKKGAGAHINPGKTQPAALGELLLHVDINDESSDDFVLNQMEAMKACRLDPEFPTPLMTKTIALVSAIGRTDFTTLESDELGTLTHQLEHLLLVDIPETEMPARTRLAFAATRLAKIAESRLASPDLIAGWAKRSRQDGVNSKGITNELDLGRIDPIAQFLGESNTELHQQLEVIANRVFSLIRRVLRERPDRVRLWTHALVIARRLGASGLGQLFQDIEDFGSHPVNRLASQYVLGNSYAVLSAEAIRAAQILVDPDAAGWRRAAALRFLRSVSGLSRSIVISGSNSWFVQRSFNQFCVGLYCAGWLIRNAGFQARQLRIRFNADILDRGGALLSGTELSPPARVALAWWASKFELRKAELEATPLVAHLGMLVGDLIESHDYWAFFPSSTPMPVLVRMLKDKTTASLDRRSEGWWLDALKQRENLDFELLAKSPKTAKVVRALTSSGHLLPLPRWLDRAYLSLGDTANEWRIGEWTCLEIVRQAANLLAPNNIFDSQYVRRTRNSKLSVSDVCAHPMNFALPAEVLDSPVKSWEDWQSRLRPSAFGVVKIVPERVRLHDSRYAPLAKGSASFQQNQIRGLGLCLYGLLSRSFILPVQWNGYGHQDVLRYLAQLLRSKIAYSSATLGLLDACLQPRASENLFAIQTNAWTANSDDDTSGDPIQLIDAEGVAIAISRIQEDLVRNQLSTYNHRVRQLTPINLMHLTDTNWKQYFGEKE